MSDKQNKAKEYKCPHKFLKSKYRKEMWDNYKKVINEVDKKVPISEAYLLGSFASNKKRPGDVDLFVLVKTKKHNHKKWAVDLEIAPDNKFGDEALEDLKKWMKQKYGAKKSGVYRLK